MKVLFLSAQYPPDAKGGGELSTHIIARGLIALGHTVQVVTSGDEIKTYEADEVSVLVLPLGLRKKPLFERRQSLRAAKICRAHIPDIEEYDIVHAHDFRSALMLSELHLPRTLVTARDYAQICGCTNNIQYNGNIDPGCQGAGELWKCHRVHEASWARKIFRIWQYMYNRPYRKSAFASLKHQIFISHAQKEYIVKYQDLSKQHASVIYNPISPEYISSPLAKGREGNILYVGRVEMYKGARLLLSAWRRIVKDGKNGHLTIVGNGAQYQEYERLAATWGLQYRVTFLPHVPHHRLQKLIDESEIVVAPHLWIEPFGRNVIEGMARGKVVIASNIGGPAELINLKGAAGLLFERGSVDGLVRAIDQVFEMGMFDKKEMGTAARDFVRDNLNMEKIAKSHENFYEKIIK